MAVNRLLDRGYDYDSVIDSDGDFVLRLNYGAFYDRFVRFCKDYNVAHEVEGLKKKNVEVEYMLDREMV
jgi:hypothetical protein